MREGMVVQVSGPGGGGVGIPGEPQPARLLTNAALDEIRAIPGVAFVIPRDFLMANLIVKYQKMEAGVSIIGVETTDLSDLGLEAVEGETTLGRGTVVIGSQVPSNFYDPRIRPGQEPPPPPELYGQQIQLTVFKYDQQGNETRKNFSLRVTGVLKQTLNESDWTIYFPLEQVKALNEWSQGRRINYNKDGYSQVIVKVQDVEQVLDISEQITDMGFQAFTPQSFVQGINNFYVILQFIFGGVGAIALLVAAIGISNTMAMSIL